MRQSRSWTLLIVAAAYVLVGMGTAFLAGTASSQAGVKAWRFVAWFASLLVFAFHLVRERARGDGRTRAALWVAAAVALGAAGVAALGPLRAHWSEPARLRLALLSVVAWPLLVGIPAFCVAVVFGALLERRSRIRPTPGPAA